MARRPKTETRRSVKLSISLSPELADFISETNRSRSHALGEILHRAMTERKEGLAFLQQWMESYDWILAYYSLTQVKTPIDLKPRLITLNGDHLIGANRYDPAILASHFEVLMNRFKDYDNSMSTDVLFNDLAQRMVPLLLESISTRQLITESCKAVMELCSDASAYQTEALIASIEQLHYTKPAPGIQDVKLWAEEMKTKE